MDKYEYKLKYDEIKKKIKEREFQEAVEIADTIDWKKIRSVSTLCQISDLYKINRRYKEAKVLLEQAYERYPNGKNIVYSLCELCIKMEEIVQSIDYYKQFVSMAPSDNGKFILQYKIYEAQDVSLEERIQVLEELKKREYKEKWGYELAYLYHRIGLITKCVEECDELILWYREGSYVKKALELKMLHQQLTENQKDIYEEMLSPKEHEEFIRQNTTEIKKEDPEDDIKVKTMDMSKYNTLNLQKELAESMKDVLVVDEGFKTLATADDENAKPGTYIPDDFSIEKRTGEIPKTNEHPGTTTENISRTIINDTESDTSSEIVAETGSLTANTPKPGDMEEIIFQDDMTEPEIIAKEVKEEAPVEDFAATPYDPVKDLELTMMYDSDHVASKLEAVKSQMEEKQEDIDEEAVEESMVPKVGTNTAELINLNDTLEIVDPIDPIERTKVFNREELNAVAKAYNSSLHEDNYGFSFDDPSIKQPHDDLSDHITEHITEEITLKNRDDILDLIDKRVQEAIAKVLDANREVITPTVAPAAEAVVPAATTVIPPVNVNPVSDRVPKAMENILSQDYDGQISLIVPDAPVVEKQITGQMNIEDVLNEWENIKKQQQEKAGQRVAEKILAETGPLFTDTESLRIDGILEKLQRDEVPDDVDTEAEYEKYIKQLMEEEEAAAEIEKQNDEAAKSEKPEKSENTEAVVEDIAQEVAEGIAADIAEIEQNPEEISESGEVETEGSLEENSEETSESNESSEENDDNDEVEELTEIEEVSDENSDEVVNDVDTTVSEDTEETDAEVADATEDTTESEEVVLTPEALEAQAQAKAAQEAAELAMAQAEEARRVAEEAAKAALVAQEEAIAAKAAEIENNSKENEDEKETASEKPVEITESEKVSEAEETKESVASEKEDAKSDGPIDSRSMSEDELAFFAQFAQTKRARQNLLHALDKISLAAYTGNVFVTGETADESIELAKNVIRYVKNTDGNFTGKIAKVNGDALNNKMISTMVEKLANGGLIIEKASLMSAETTKDLIKSLNQEKTGIVVALQDTKKNMFKMMEHFDGMKQIFNVHIEVEELSDDALVAYGKKYAEHLEYSIDDMGILALHQRIDILQTSDHIVTVSDVRDILDEAIERANKKSFRHFTDVLLAKRYDDEDMIILRESDFITKD